MFSKLHLYRPLAVFDIEATGLNIRTDRIVELSIIRVSADWTEETRTWLLNPTIPIPLESTAIHGITDADVADCPTFLDVVDEIDTFLADCDLAGFNLIHFDIPMLQEEFLRCGRELDVDSRRVLDAQRIYHAMEPRDLSAALKFFCGREHMDAHGAEADARATLDVIKGEFEKYSEAVEDFPSDMEAVDRRFNARDPLNADRAGRIRWINGELCVNFGKKKGTPLRQLHDEDPGFLKWMVKSDFPFDTRQLAADALEGRYPSPPRPVAFPQSPAPGRSPAPTR